MIFVRAVLFVLAAHFLVAVANAQDNIAIPSFGQEPAAQFRDTSETFGFETIDPFTGKLKIVSRDLTVPSNGGLDIVVTRYYLSMPENDVVDPEHLVGRTTTGVGWHLHFGRIYAVDPLAKQTTSTPTGCLGLGNDSSTNPVLELPDGTRETLVTIAANSNDSSVPGAFMTRSFWLGKCITDSNDSGGDSDNGGLIVMSPEGIEYRFDFRHFASLTSPDLVYHVTKITHPNGTSIDINYEPVSSSPQMAEINTVVHSEGQTLSFTYTNAGTVNSRLTRVKQNGEPNGVDWDYSYDTVTGRPNYYYLDKVTRPDGEEIDYTYYESGTAGRHSLRRVTAPGGGQVTYTYTNKTFPQRDGTAGGIPRTVVSKKQTGGRVNQAGTWDYYYYPSTSSSTQFDRTYIDGPINCVLYEHRVNQSGGGDPPLWQIGTLNAMKVGASGCTTNSISGVIHEESYTWSSGLISSEQGEWRPFFSPDLEVRAPRFESVVVKRDGGSTQYSINHSDWDAYNNPGTIEESGPLDSRTRELTYTAARSQFSDSDVWIVKRVEDETLLDAGNVLNASGSVINNYDHEIDRTYVILSSDSAGSIGDLKSESVADVLTTYRYFKSGNSRGELSSIKDAKGTANDVSFPSSPGYKRGIPQRENQLESVVITRTVNNDGTVDSQTEFPMSGLDGNTTDYDYNGINLLTDVTTPKASDDDVTISWAYSSTVGITRTLTRGTFREVRQADGFGNIEKITVTDTNPNNSVSHFQDFDYDALGRLTARYNPDSTTKKTTFTYDELGRREVTTRQACSVAPPCTMSRTYQSLASGLLLTETDERGNETKYTYRAYGNPDAIELVKVENVPESVVVNVSRNRLGQITQVSRGGVSRVFQYNTNFFLKQETHPEIGLVVYGRDAVGNMTSRKVGGSATTTFDWDDQHRLEGINYPSGGVATPDIDLTYWDDNLLKSVTTGSGGDTTSTWSYLYDENGNLTDEDLVYTRPGVTEVFNIGYAYDSRDALAQIDYPSGTSVDYAPNALGRPTKAGVYASNIDYFANGQIKEVDFGNGTTSTFGQDDRLFPTTLKTENATFTLVDMEYDYDNAGNVDQITDNRNSSRTRNLGHDGLNRLETADGSWGTGSILYDARGNLDQMTLGGLTLNYTVNSTSNRLTSVSNVADYDSFQYDNYGNVTKTGLAAPSFTYNEASNLASFGAGPVATFEYDGNNRLILKDTSAGRTHFVYNHKGVKLFEDSSDTVSASTTDYIYLGSRLIASQWNCVALTDTDSDGIPDCHEVRLNLDPNFAGDAADDFDGDGVSNLDEYLENAQLYDNDTDDDGFDDGYEINAGSDPTDPLSLPDSDSDGVTDDLDNCINQPNGPLILDAGGFSQRDVDGDGYGSMCDGDFDNNLFVNFADLAALKANFGTMEALYDMNGDGFVNFADLALFRSGFGAAPGPSGIAP